VSPLLHHQALDALYIFMPFRFSVQNPKSRVRRGSVGAASNAGFIEGDRFVDAAGLL
jgi:hypothetical protein